MAYRIDSICSIDVRLEVYCGGNQKEINFSSNPSVNNLLSSRTFSYQICNLSSTAFRGRNSLSQTFTWLFIKHWHKYNSWQHSNRGQSRKRNIWNMHNGFYYYTQVGRTCSHKSKKEIKDASLWWWWCLSGGPGGEDGPFRHLLTIIVPWWAFTCQSDQICANKIVHLTVMWKNSFRHLLTFRLMSWRKLRWYDVFSIYLLTHI